MSSEQASAGAQGLRRRWPDVRFGFCLPQVFTETDVDMEAVRQVATRADEAGLDSVWTQSQVTGVARVLEPLTLLSYVAAITQQVRLGCATLNVTEHNPVQLAKLVSTVDNLSGGRAVAALGMGAPHLRLRMGDPAGDRPVRQVLETIELMRALWADGPVDHQGDLWQIEGEEMNPKPVQERLPIWLSGKVPAALRRAVRRSDGWIGAGAYSTDEFRAHAAQLGELLDEHERPRDDFVIAKRIYVAVEDSRDEAARRLRARFERYSHNPDDSVRFCVHGTPEQVAAGVEEILDVGVDLVVLNPVYDFSRQQVALLDLLGP